ncbi:hypothetical protein [Streptomyces sp. NPDC051561]|uniref:hypothetical protein n=1 Tax=Streptomyces sp. NPDC051561 TaxID=3365658 RepID=UPI0037B4EF53
MCNPAWALARIAAQRLHALVRLRRVRDRLERELARPLDVLALARDAGMTPGELGRDFLREYGESPYTYVRRRRTEQALLRVPAPSSAGALSGLRT